MPLDRSLRMSDLKTLPKNRMSRRALARLLRQASRTVEGPKKLVLRRMAGNMDKIADARGDKN